MKLQNVMFAILFSFSSGVFGVTLKIGLLAPEGTTWGEGIKKLTNRIKKETDGQVKFKVYYGGVQGDEPYVLRKIRLGQMHGGVFTGKTLGEISGDIRAMEIPFTFDKDRSLAWKTLSDNKDFFNQKFEDKKFMNLGFFEVGLVYLISTKKIENFEQMKNIKIWAWEGDQLSASMIKSMNLSPVVLPLPDVLASLSTGVLQATYAPPLGILAMQWQTKVKYLINFPITYSVGAFVLSEKAYKKIDKKYHNVVKKVSQEMINEINEQTKKDNVEALVSIKNSGVEFINFPKEAIEQGRNVRKKVISELQGNLFSKEAVSIIEGISKKKVLKTVKK